jgi:hypothetical protein
LQYVKPFFSPNDIEKGAKWNSEIAKELETSNIGVICLTPDNTDQPWILFESGALSKSLDKAHVCTLLFGLDAADIRGPLTSFQATKFVQDDFKRLVSTINSTAGDSKLDTAVLDSVFDMWWPKLEQEVTGILKFPDTGAERKRRPERDILEEILELTRMNAVRAHGLSRVSTHNIDDLIQNLLQLLVITYRDPENMRPPAIEALVGRPLQRLCMEAGIPERYEIFRMRMREMMPQALGMDEKTLAQDPHTHVSKPRHQG